MYTINDVVEIVEDTSLSEAIIEGVSPSRIRDVELSALWEEARDVLIRIQELMDLRAGEDEDDDEEQDEDSLDFGQY